MKRYYNPSIILHGIKPRLLFARPEGGFECAPIGVNPRG